MFDGEPPSGARDETWNAFLARGAEVPLAAVREREAQVTPDTVMDLMFTSGTTGRPKGVMTRTARTCAPRRRGRRSPACVPTTAT